MLLALRTSGAVRGRDPPWRFTYDRQTKLLEQQRPGILDELLQANQEPHGFAAVDDAVVVGERDVHHRPDLHLTVDGNRTVLNLVQAENADLWRVQNRRAEQ